MKSQEATLSKSVLALLLALALVFALLPAIGAAAANDNAAIYLGADVITGWDSSSGYDYVYFGKYESGTMSGISGTYDGIDESSGKAKNVQYAERMDYSNLGSYTGGSVKWRVLDTKMSFDGDSDGENDPGLFLLSEYLLGTTDFDINAPSSYVYSGSTYQGSPHQGWNMGFYNGAFSDTEKNFIAATYKSDDATKFPFTAGGNTYYTDYTASPSNLAGDKVFFMSAGEMANRDYGFETRDNRAASFESHTQNNSLILFWWWLRSPIMVQATQYGNDRAGVIRHNGEASYADFLQDQHLTSEYLALPNISIPYFAYGARPALNIKLDDIIFTSATADGGYKFTLPDSTRDSFSATAQYLTNGTVEFNYSGAAVGTNEYISAVIIRDNSESEAITYYDGIVQPASASGTAEIVLPRGFDSATDTLKVFSEQKNGEFYTDYASALVPLTLSGLSEKPPVGGGGGPAPAPEPTPEPEDEIDIIDEGPALAAFTPDRVAYIHGYPDGTVRPDGSLSRAQATAMLWRLLSDEEKNGATTAVFTDVAEDAWYVREVSYLADIGIITGYDDGTFKPDKMITRAEFTVILSRFFDISELAPPSGFDDTAGHWAESYINNAVERGWIDGYPDGTFRPDTQITRAAAVTMINKMLGFTLDVIPDDAPVFTDLNEDHWAYTDLIIATYEPAEVADGGTEDAEDTEPADVAEESDDTEDTDDLDV